MSRVSSRMLPLPVALRPLNAELTAQPYPGVRALWSRATLRPAGDPVFGIEGLVVHTAQRSGTDQALALMQAGRASWHWIIPAEGEDQHGQFLWSAAPEGRAARHLPNRLTHPGLAQGRPRLNQVTLSVLLAADPGHPGRAPSGWQIAMLGQLVRHLWSRYPALATVVCRSDIDPDTPPPGWNWDLLRAQVTGLPAADLPPLVACATPLALLDRPAPAEPALRAN